MTESCVYVCYVCIYVCVCVCVFAGQGYSKLSGLSWHPRWENICLLATAEGLWKMTKKYFPWSYLHTFQLFIAGGVKRMDVRDKIPLVSRMRTACVCMLHCVS